MTYLKPTYRNLAIVVTENVGKHLVCPECGGGAKRERSFVIQQRHGSLYYKCYRASCGIYGYVDQGASYRAPSPKKAVRPYTGDTRGLGPTELEYIARHWYLTKDDAKNHGMLVDVVTGRLVFPLFDYEGNNWGHLLRSITGSSAKTVLYWHRDDVPKLHFPRGRKNSESLLIVEDVISANRAAAFNHSCALLGTNTALHNLCAVRNVGQKKLIMALDADATGKAIEAKQRYGLVFEEFRVVPLIKDIKNMSPDEIKDFIGKL